MVTLAVLSASSPLPGISKNALPDRKEAETSEKVIVPVKKVIVQVVRVPVKKEKATTTAAPAPPPEKGATTAPPPEKGATTAPPPEKSRVSEVAEVEYHPDRIHYDDDSREWEDDSWERDSRELRSYLRGLATKILGKGVSTKGDRFLKLNHSGKVGDAEWKVHVVKEDAGDGKNAKKLVDVNVSVKKA